MKRISVFFLAVGLVLLSANAFAQRKPTGKTPAKQIPVMAQEIYKGTKYYLIPYEVVFEKSHEQLQGMFADKYSFFFIVIDNRQGAEPVVFDPRKGEVTLIMDDKSRRVMVDLTNTLKDADAGAKVSAAFKQAYVPIEVAKGEMKHTLTVFQPFKIADIRTALWSFPGENKVMKFKRMQLSDVSRFKLEAVGEEKAKKKTE